MTLQEVNSSETIFCIHAENGRPSATGLWFCKTTSTLAQKAPLASLAMGSQVQK